MSEKLSYWVNCICNNCFNEVSVEFPNGKLVELKDKVCTVCGCKDTLQRQYPKTFINPPNISATYPPLISLPYISTECPSPLWTVYFPEKPPEWNLNKTAP
jgi:hypothetical protein